MPPIDTAGHHEATKASTGKSTKEGLRHSADDQKQDERRGASGVSMPWTAVIAFGPSAFRIEFVTQQQVLRSLTLASG